MQDASRVGRRASGARVQSAHDKSKRERALADNSVVATFVVEHGVKTNRIRAKRGRK